MRAEALRWVVRGLGLAVGFGLVLLFVGGLYLAGRVLVLVFVAVLLAAALEPIVGWLRGRLPLGRGPTILLVYLAFFCLVAVLALLVVPAAVNQANDLATRLPPFLQQARDWAAELRPRALATSATALVDAARSALTPQAPDPDAVVAAGVGAAEVVVSIVSLLAILFFWLTEHARLQRYALAFLPAHRRPGARRVWNDIELRLGGWVRGQLLLMGIVGLSTGLAYAALGLEPWMLLGVIAALTEAIPIVGPMIGVVPALLVAATVGPELVLAVALVYVVVHVIEGNVLVPLVMRNTIGLSPFLVLVSLLIGAAVGGILGAFLAVPLVASIEVILERLQARDTPVPQDPNASDMKEDEVESSPEAELRREGTRERLAREGGQP
ncbi:MAG TPA: AI-2E family transporter [Candidatus Limnocylindrales bacterium]|nr:AI-2E family transporter [Candidatus Limnocylindrales bacterium]